MKDNIALIGFMGTGKSSVGIRLAEKLGKKFLEMDSLIEERTGQTIPEIFARSEIEFREIEMQLVKEISQQSNLVIATGGGVILNKLNIDYLKQSCDIVLLEAPAKVIFERIMAEGKDKRPLLNKPDPMTEIQHLLQFRRPLYEAATEIHINTANKTLDMIVKEILDHLQPEERNAPPLQKNEQLEMQLGDFGEFEGFKEKDTCFICEQPLKKLESPQILTCSICNQTSLAYQYCVEGHFVCDKCYNSDLKANLESLSQTSLDSNPITIAEQILTYPKLKFRGPQCAMIVSTSLLIGTMNSLKEAPKNAYGHVDIPRIIIAITRASVIPGDFTAFYGVDNAALGIGIATAVFLDATHKRPTEIEHANQATAKCLEVLNYGTMDPKEAILQALQFGIDYFTEQFNIAWLS